MYTYTFIKRQQLNPLVVCIGSMICLNKTHRNGTNHSRCLALAELIRRHWRQESASAVAVRRFRAVLKGSHILLTKNETYISHSQ